MALGLKVGDKVAWHHTLAATAEAVRQDSLPVAHFPGEEGEPAPSTPVGEITEVANPEGTWFKVRFGEEEKVLTFEELVRVVD